MENLEFKGSTGDWSLLRGNGRHEVFLGDFKGEVQFWDHHGDTMTKKESLANANLFLASREILESLQEMTNWCRNLKDWATTNKVDLDPPIEKSEKAINKALGK